MTELPNQPSCPTTNNKLTFKQEKAVQHFLKNGNKSAAYRHAYNTENMKPASVNVKAVHFFQQVKIRSRIEKAKYKAEISTQRVLEEEKCLSQIDPGELCNKDGTLIPITELPERVRRAIKSFERKEIPRKKGPPVVIWKYKFWDKGRSLERLSKHLGLYAADNAQKAITMQILGVIMAGTSKEAQEAIWGLVREKLGGDDGQTVDLAPLPGPTDQDGSAST